MSLHRYAAECTVLRTELIESLTASQIELLRQDISTLGEREWKLWFLKNLGTVKQYVLATPSKRQKTKGWQDPHLKRQLVFGGILYLTHAEYFLNRIEAYDLQPGQSYRDMAAAAGWAYWDVRFQKGNNWPFDDQSPFCEGSLISPFF